MQYSIDIGERNCTTTVQQQCYDITDDYAGGISSRVTYAGIYLCT